MRGYVSNLLRLGLNRSFFKKDDLQKFWKQIQEKHKQTKNDWNSQDNKQRANKFLIGLGIYFAVTLTVYELKKEREIHITVDEVFQAIRQSQCSQILVLKESNPEKLADQDKEKQDGVFEPRDNFRKIFLKIEGVSYVCYVPEIQLFYQKLALIEKNKMISKVKILEQDYIPFDKELKRFFSTVNKVILPLLFPILLFNSSLGKIFKSNVLGQAEAFRPTIKFKDVAGLGNAKIEISELVDFLRNPQKYKKIGAKVPKGALLSGPPGTGKTMLAKACAGQANVPFFSVSGSEFVELFAGMGAVRVRQLFKNAKKQTPAIIFIDEIDAIGRKRQDKFGGANDERANTLNQLLVEMDGFGTTEDIIILAATNRKEMLDSALTRPGRFDRMVEIQLPDIKGRQQILEIYLKQIKLSPEQTLQDYSKRLATLTYGFSGADIANLCNQAAILAVRNGSQFVQPTHFQLASQRVLAGLQQNLSLQQSQKKKIAFHESGHAVVAWFSEGAAPLLKITIIPRSKGSLGFAQYLPNQSSLQNKKQLIDQICVILGGRMSEELFFKECSSGAADDLQKVRNLARAMVLKFGMSDAFTNYAPIDNDGDNIYSQQTSAKIDREIMKVVQQCTKLTERTVKLYRDKIESLATEVLKKETLSHQEIKSILGPRPFEPKQNYKEFLTHSSDSNRSEITI